MIHITLKDGMVLEFSDTHLTHAENGVLLISHLDQQEVFWQDVAGIPLVNIQYWRMGEGNPRADWACLRTDVSSGLVMVAGQGIDSVY